MSRTAPPPRRARRRPRLLLVELAVGVVLLGGLVLARGLTDPALLGRALGLLDRDGAWEITLQEVEILPTSRPLEPSTWRLALVGLALQPQDPALPSAHVRRLYLAPPRLQALWTERRLRLPFIRLVGLDVDADRGAPWPGPRLPAPLRGVQIDQLQLQDANLTLHTDGDAPLRADGLRGELLDVGWDPSAGLRADGRLVIDRWQAGRVAIDGARIRSLALRDGLTWFDARFVLAGGDARVRGELAHPLTAPQLQAEVELTGARLAEAVQRVTGRPAPAEGRLDAALQITLGGEDDAALAEGAIHVTDGRVPLGDERPLLATELLRLSPRIQITDGALAVEEAEGTIRIDGRSMEIEEIRARGPGARLQIRGELTEARRRIVIRVLPQRDPAARPGFGLVLEGDDGLRMRRADRQDLLPGEAEVTADAGNR